jgi:hypothetical protein
MLPLSTNLFSHWSIPLNSLNESYEESLFLKFWVDLSWLENFESGFGNSPKSNPVPLASCLLTYSTVL